MRLLKLLLISVAVSAALPVASASAGRLIVTGHDADFHCSGGSQCHFVEVATNWVRAGAPDPNKPVLVLDADDYDFPQALDNAFGVGAVPRATMDPTSAEFAAEPLTTDRYSAILVASDTTCGGCDLNIGEGGEGGDVSTLASETPDSDAINARKADIEAFFNAGGGIYANSGANHGDGDPSTGPDVFYDFVPLPIGGVAVSPPFCLTGEGAALGFEDPSGCPDPSKHSGTRDDINCCATHNSFAEPEPGTALRVAERDTGDDGIVSADDKPETLFAEGIISGGRIVEGAADLAVTQRGTNRGNSLVYTITVTNNGPGPASGVTLTDDLPDGVTARDIKSSQGSCTGTTTVGDLQPRGHPRRRLGDRRDHGAAEVDGQGDQHRERERQQAGSEHRQQQRHGHAPVHGAVLGAA